MLSILSMSGLNSLGAVCSLSLQEALEERWLVPDRLCGRRAHLSNQLAACVAASVGATRKSDQRRPRQRDGRHNRPVQGPIGMGRDARAKAVVIHQHMVWRSVRRVHAGCHQALHQHGQERRKRLRERDAQARGPR